MIQKILLCLIIAYGFNLNLSYGQEKSIEDRWFDCVYSGYEDGGQAVKQIFTDFEKLLLEDGILDEFSPDGLRALVSAMASGEVAADDKYSGLIAKLTEKESMSDNNKINACQKDLEDTPEYSIIAKVQDAMSDLIDQEDISIKVYANNLMPLLDEMDMDSDFAKMMVLIGFDLEQILRPALRSAKTIEDLKSDIDQPAVFAMTIVRNDRISVDGVEFETEEEFNKAVYDFALSHSFNSIFEIVNPEDASAENLQVLKDMITAVVVGMRNEYAREVLGKPFDELPETQQLALELEFPLVIREKWN